MMELWNGILGWFAARIGEFFGWFTALFNSGLGWLLDQIPDIVIPGWVSQGPDAISRIMGTVGQLSSWFPVDLFVPVLLLVFTVSLIALGIRIARIVASFATLGGGA